MSKAYRIDYIKNSHDSCNTGWVQRHLQALDHLLLILGGLDAHPVHLGLQLAERPHPHDGRSDDRRIERSVAHAESLRHKIQYTPRQKWLSGP